MADWKKIIVSGSDAHLKNISASGTIKGPIVTSSNLNPLLNFDGNRTVSNTNLPNGIYNTNFGTSGDLTNFIDAVFFTNTPPVIEPPSQSFTVQEWTTGTANIQRNSGFVTFTDAEFSNEEINQNITFTIEDNPFFEILNGNTTRGQIKVKSGVTVSKSLNTHPSAAADGTIFTYPLDVTITDAIGASDTEKIYIHVIPNEKPVLLDYSTSTPLPTLSTSEVDEYGNVKTIYEFTASALSEETEGNNLPGGFSSQGNQFGGFSIRHSDVNNDTITFEGDFETQLDVQGNQYVNFLDTANYHLFRQITASFDFESSSFFNFIITASDQHYPSPDTSSVVYLKYHLPISDNPPPAIENQNFTINEDSADSTEVTNSPITISDTETLSSGKAFFLINNFNLISATKDQETGTNYMLAINNITGSLFEIGESDYFKPTKDPFEVDLVGRVTKKTGAFLNANIAKYYYYSASVTDIYNENQSSSAAIMTIEILDDVLPTITIDHPTDNYIIESALSTDNISKNSLGYGSNTTLDSNGENVNLEVNTIPAGLVKSVAQNGPYGVNDVVNQQTASQFIFKPTFNISESVYTFDAGNTINVGITASKTSFPSAQVFKDFTLNITKNHSPIITDTQYANITVFNALTEGTVLYQLSFTEPENNGILLDEFTLTGPQSNTLTQLSSSIDGTDIQIKAKNHLSASTTYNFTASIIDEHNFRISSISRSFTVGAKNTGSLSISSGPYFLIESAENGAKVTTSTSGIFADNKHVSFSVDYSKGDTTGNPTVQSFTASVIGTYSSPLANHFSISSGSIGSEGGLLSIIQNISESVFNQDSNDGVAARVIITYQDQFGNIGGYGTGGDNDDATISINPIDNLAPIITDTGTDYSSFYFDYAALNGTTLKSYDFLDPEGDSVPTNIAITSSNTTDGLIALNNSNRLTIRANQNLSVGAYHFTASIGDEHYFRTSSVSGTINIAGNTVGALRTNRDTTFIGNEGEKPLFFIEEDGRDTNFIHTLEGEQDSIFRGVPAELTVDYDSTGLSLQAFSITSPSFDINTVSSTNGVLKLGQDISGSNNNGGFSPSEILAGTAIITASVSFTDNSPSANTNSDFIYIKIFPNASSGTLTANTASNADKILGKPLFYIQECGINGEVIHTQTGETSGNGNGNQATIGGSYLNPVNNSTGLTATNFRTSSNTTPNVKIDSSTGTISLGQNISGSNNNGGFSPTQIDDGTAFFSVPVAFNDSNSNNITIYDSIYVKIFPNASLGQLTRATGTATHTDDKFKFFLQECAESGDPVRVGSLPNHAQADLGVNYGSTGLSVAGFGPETTFGNSDVTIAINNSGLVSLNSNISGSVDVGDIITVSASFTDNGASSVTLQDSFFIEIVDNHAPNINIQSSPDDEGTMSLPLTANTVIRTFKISDDEDDIPFTASLGGTNADKFYIASSSNDNNESTTYEVKVLNTLENDTSNQALTYKIIASDSVGKTTTTSNITTNFKQAPNRVFAYNMEFGSNLNGIPTGLLKGMLGGVNTFDFESSPTNELDPSTITNVLTGSVIAHFQSGSIGQTFNPAFVLDTDQPINNKPCTLNNSAELTKLKTINGIESLGEITFSGKGVWMFLFPSSSTLQNKPRNLASEVNFSAGETADNTFQYTTQRVSDNVPLTSRVMYFNTSESYFGYNTWGLIHSLSVVDNQSKTIRLIDAVQKE